MTTDSSDKKTGIRETGKIHGSVLAFLKRSAWLILLYSQLLSIIIFLLGAYGFIQFLIQGKWQDSKYIIHGLLQATEMLLLVPVPVVIGVIVYDLLIDLATPEKIEIGKGEQSYSIAKIFLVGIIITLTGTGMLDLLITSEGTWEMFLGGFFIITSLSAYIYVTRRP